MVTRLEWWPEYQGGPLWNGGRTVPLDDLALPGDLVVAIESWVGSYADEGLPIDGPGDDE